MNLRFIYDERVRRGVMLALCVLVFMFALHAKTSVYNGNAPAKVTPATASKLWLSGQKMEVQSVDSNNSVVLWIALLCVFALYPQQGPRVSSVFLTPPPRSFSLRYVHRFLRPPPARA